MSSVSSATSKQEVPLSPPPPTIDDLSSAIQQGALSQVQQILDQGVNPNALDREGNSPLFLAAKEERVDIVKELLNRGADPNQESAHLGAPLFAVIEHNGNSAILSLLLKKGANPNAQSKNYHRTPLHFLASSHSLPEKTKTALANKLLEKGANINAQDIGGSTPLMEAAQEGNLDIVLWLIEKGVNLHLQTQSRNTALHYAIWRCPISPSCVDIASVLLIHGANPWTQNLLLQSPVHMIFSQRAAYKLQSQRDFDGLFSPPNAQWELEAIRLLSRHHANLNQTDNQGMTALHLAASWGCTDILSFLIEQHIDLNQTDIAKRTAMHHAVANREAGALRLLLQKGANPNLKDDRGRTPLHIAASNGFTDILFVFFEKAPTSSAAKGEKRSMAAPAGESKHPKKK